MRSTSLILSTALVCSTVVGSVAAAYSAPAKVEATVQKNATSSEVKVKIASKKVSVQVKKNSESEHKYTICHATNSATNPYVMITVDYNSIVKKAGHDGHDGPVATSEKVAAELKSEKISWGDVIPAIAEHDYAGKNFTSEGVLLLNNDCEMPNVIATEDPIDEEDEDTTGGNGGSTEEDTDTDTDTETETETETEPETETPGKGSVDDTDTTGDSTETPTEEGKGGVATELPETGANWVASIVAVVASAGAAALAYGAQNVRRVAASLLNNQ